MARILQNLREAKLAYYSRRTVIATIAIETMPIEVEQKFPVANVATLARQLVSLGWRQTQPVEQVDTYFAHPQRDFSKTDEALRVRRVGRSNYITYKGAKLDLTTKTRREVEIELASGDEAAAFDLLGSLGFAVVAEVRKKRSHAAVSWRDWQVEVSLDDVASLGTFVELECVTSEDRTDAARRAIAELATELGLRDSERRSYLELLLQAGDGPGPQAICR